MYTVKVTHYTAWAVCCFKNTGQQKDAGLSAHTPNLCIYTGPIRIETLIIGRHSRLWPPSLLK